MSTVCCKGCINDVVGCLTADDVLRVHLSGLTDGEIYVAVITDTQGNAYGVPFGYNDVNKYVDLPIGSAEGQIPATVFNTHIGDLVFEVQNTNGQCVPFKFMTWTKCVDLSVINHFSAYYNKDEVGLEQ